MINKNTLLILAATGFGLWYVTNKTRRVTSTGAMSLNMGGNVSVPSTVKEIFNNDVPGQPGYGWKYYTDGTAIGPDGSYYKDNQKVWSPT